MGNLCLPSRPPEVEDRQRVDEGGSDSWNTSARTLQSDGADTHVAPPTSTTVPIGMPGRNRQSLVDELSRSYTEARMEEENFFDSIIKRTENDLINANDDGETIGDGNSASRLSRYLAAHNRTRSGKTTLPTSAVEPGDIAATLDKAVITATDTTWLATALQQVVAALDNVQVEHHADVVVEFPDFSD